MGHGIGSRVLSALLGLVLLFVARPTIAAEAAPTTAMASVYDATADSSYPEAALAAGSGSDRAYQVDHVGHVTGNLLYQILAFVGVGQQDGERWPSVCSSSTRIAPPPSDRRTSAMTAAARSWSRRSARVIRQASITSAEAGRSLAASGRAATISVCPSLRTTTV